RRSRGASRLANERRLPARKQSYQPPITSAGRSAETAPGAGERSAQYAESTGSLNHGADHGAIASTSPPSAIASRSSRMRSSGLASAVAIQVRRNPDSSRPPRNDQPSAAESVVIVGVSAVSAGGLRAAASHCR